MEILLLSWAIAYMVTSKFHQDTAQAAYKAGHEPPGLVKARMRHEAGGGLWKPRPGKASTPKGPGATRLRVANRWARSCEKARIKGEHRLERWKAWYAEQAPQRDEAWREKQRRRLEKAAERTERWQQRWTGAKDTVKSATSRGTRTDDAPAEPDQPSQQTDTDTATDVPDTNTTNETEQLQGDQAAAGATPSPEQREQPQDPPTSPAPAAAIPQRSTNTSVGGIVDYFSAANALRAAAERIEQYRTDLSAMADGLGGKQWGVEVHGPIRDMDTNLSEIAGSYRDLAAQMQQQGDNVRDAEDAHPYVPGEQVVNA